MHCARYRDSVHELTDGTIGPIRRAALDLHLEACADCRTLVRDLQMIRDRAASLDPLDPPARVWLQLAGRLRQEGRVRPIAAPALRLRSTRHAALLAIAAALLMAVGASIATLLPRFTGRNTASTTATAPGAPAGGGVSAETTVEDVEAEFRLAEQHYQNAIAKLEQAAQLDRAAAGQGDEATLDPQTAAMLQKNLQVIDQAIAESRAALRGEPQSGAARDSLFDALKRKVALLQDSIALMNEMRKGNALGAAQIIQGGSKS